MTTGQRPGLDLTGSDAPARARSAVREALAAIDVASELRERSYDVQLVATELVTNAVLHGQPPIRLHLDVEGGCVRVAVDDGSLVVPMAGIATAEAMTGRGLSLVARLAHRWGVDRHEEGKSVWAELVGAQRTDDAAALVDPELTDDLPLADPQSLVTIELGDVPTDLLIAAKAHVDNLVREFALARTGAATGQAARVPPDLARLLSSVTNRFAVARLEIKRQAAGAARAGQKRTNLVLSLPASAASAAGDYLAALDSLDSYARASRLLTLETAPQHRVFRHWYLGALIAGLDAADRGQPIPRPPTFENALLREVAALSGAYRASDRAARLQRVTAALATATTDTEVADIVVHEGVSALGASGGSLVVPLPDQHLGVPGAVGYSGELLEQLREEPLDAPLPAAAAMRTGEAVWIESRQERDRRFPVLTGFEPDTVAMCAIPLVTATGLRGALRFSFDAMRLFDDDERAFVLALAAETAQALERADLYAAERAARETAETSARRLAVVQELTAALAGANTVEEVTAVVVGRTRQALGAGLASLCVLQDADTLRVAGLLGARPEAERRFATFSVRAQLPASEAARTGLPVVVPDRTTLIERFPDLATLDLPERALVCLPLTVRSDCLGALSFTFDDAELVARGDEMDLLTTIAQQCATALQRVFLIEAERDARSRAGFLAEASETLASSLEPEETLEHMVSLLVPRYADWAATYLVGEESGALRTTLGHRDPAVAERLRAVAADVPLDAAAAGGVGEVLRTGRSVWYRNIPDEVRARISGGAGRGLAGELMPHTGIVVPLTLSGQVIGAVACARVEDDRPYGEDDLRLLEDFAARSAVAVGNARAYARARDAAVTLQTNLLPQTIPQLPGLSFCWSYRPAGTGTLVGGDWYDVLDLGDGQVGIVIGDVMGRGVAAAVVMGRLRAMAQAHATSRVPPGGVLERLDAVLAGYEQTHIATALYGVLDIAQRRLTLASAGHLPPLLLAPGAANRFLDVEPGPPLGAGGAAAYPTTVVDLPPHATLLLYTDGLVEDHAMPVEEGMRRLCEGLQASVPAQVCEDALRALGRDQLHEDDTAVLAVTLA